MTYDVAIVGGGIVGLATAYRLKQSNPDLHIAILEKESQVATHQSGRNSGVIHAGVYYKPGSHKAILCARGKKELEAFCTQHEIPFRTCGKVIVAVSDEEVPRLNELERRAKANDVDVKRLASEEVSEREPFVRAVAGLWVPTTGVTDFGVVARKIAGLLTNQGTSILYSTQLLAAHSSGNQWTLATTSEEVHARVLVNCAGLWADKVAQLCSVTPSVQLVPFRGEYVELRESAQHLCNSLIYPVPDPQFPFLGVHLTPTIDRRVEAGPSAALAFAREGYTLGTVDLSDLIESVRYRGTRRFALQHWKMGLGEMTRSVSRRALLKAIQRLVPDVTMDDLQPRPSGVRAQAIRPDGTLADDFVIETTDNAVHVINAPSPAATASLAIGEHVAGLVKGRLSLSDTH